MQSSSTYMTEVNEVWRERRRRYHIGAGFHFLQYLTPPHGTIPYADTASVSKYSAFKINAEALPTLRRHHHD